MTGKLLFGNNGPNTIRDFEIAGKEAHDCIAKFKSSLATAPEPLVPAIPSLAAQDIRSGESNCDHFGVDHGAGGVFASTPGGDAPQIAFA